MKEFKMRESTQQQKGGAEVFIPKKRKRAIKYPKNYDPENPQANPVDPERWLPKWQRSKFRKYAKKKGIQLKGAQGDAQIDTDVTSGAIPQTTAHLEPKVAQQANKRRRK